MSTHGREAGIPEPLAPRLARLGIPDCSCDHEWKWLGRLYGCGMGYGWVRLSDAPGCPHHGRVPAQNRR